MKELGKLVLKNCLRQKQRSILTILGIAIALLAFCMIRTMVAAWYAGVNASAKNRLVTRNQISLVFSLPISYKEKIATVSGVELVGYGNWFGGQYRDERGIFAQFAIDDNYLDIYPEYTLDAQSRQAFLREKRGILVGAQLAEKYGFKSGDTLQLKGTIYPGNWDFIVSGIFHGREEGNSTRLMLFHWDYLNERNKLNPTRIPDQAGFFVMRVGQNADTATISKAVDSIFSNSYAETLTETETAFQQSFVSMSSAIIIAMDVISISVLVIVLLILANTMLMSARERMREYAILKSLGFEPPHLAIIIFGESLLISFLGFIALCLLLIPVFNFASRFVIGQLSTFFPVFRFDTISLLYAGIAMVIVGTIAGIWPFISISRISVVEGLRSVE